MHGGSSAGSTAPQRLKGMCPAKRLTARDSKSRDLSPMIPPFPSRDGVESVANGCRLRFDFRPVQPVGILNCLLVPVVPIVGADSLDTPPILSCCRLPPSRVKARQRLFSPNGRMNG